MKRLIVFLSFLSLFLGIKAQEPNEMEFKGFAFERDYPNALVGARVDNKSEDGNAGLKMISGSDTAFVYLDSAGILHIVSDKAVKIDTVEYADGSKSSSSGGVFDGNRSVKALPSVGVNYGGTNTSEWIENAFFPFINATISINSSVLYEIGTSNTVSITGSTTANDETVFSAGHLDSIYPGTQTEIYNFGASTSYSTTTTFFPKQSDAGSLTAQYRAYQTGATSGTFQSSTKSCNSVYVFLWGTSATDLTGGGTLPYTTLNKYVQPKSTKNVTWTPTSSIYPYFAYPSSYGYLTSIKDLGTNFEYISAFTPYVVNVTSVGLDENYTEEYIIYKFNTLTDIPATTYQFIF